MQNKQYHMGNGQPRQEHAPIKCTNNIQHQSKSYIKVITKGQSSYSGKSKFIQHQKFKVHNIKVQSSPYIYIESIDPGRCRGQSLQYNYQNAAYTPQVPEDQNETHPGNSATMVGVERHIRTAVPRTLANWESRIDHAQR